MDESNVRQLLDEAKLGLSKNEAEHEVLVGLVKNLEGWLRLNAPASRTLPLPIAAERPTVRMASEETRQRSPVGVKGAISVRAAVLQVLRDALGEPLHAAEIARRISALGAVTTSKNPTGVVGLVAASLQNRDGLPVEKSGPQTWRWTGGNTNSTDSV